jgi:hypothetical protein
MAKGDQGFQGHSMGGGLAAPGATAGAGQSGIMKGLNMGAGLLPSSMDLYGGGGRRPIAPTMDFNQLMELLNRQRAPTDTTTPPFNPAAGNVWGKLGRGAF